MMTTYAHDIESFQLEAIVRPIHSDLLHEIEEATKYGTNWELYRVRLIGGSGYAKSGNAMEVLYLDNREGHLAVNRAGVAWGGDAAWTDASSAEEAVERYLTDTMIP